MQRPYLLSKRNNGIWYFRLPHEKTFHSTGKTAKVKAEEFVLKLISGQKLERTTLEAYSQDFFVWGTCRWVKRQSARGISLTPLHVLNRRRTLLKHILPQFGKRYLDTLNPVEIDDWLIGLPLANQTKNHVLYTLKTIVDEAEREGVIATNPMKKVGRLADSHRKRDIFTLSELSALFPTDAGKLLTIWQNEMWAALYLLLATTGIRPGEARALQWRNIDLIRGGIYIVQALDDKGQIKTPKSGESRAVPLPTRTWDSLKSWEAETFLPNADDWVFYGVDKKPLSKKVVSTHLRPALKKAKIKIGDRYIVTYSFRHTFNTFARTILPIGTVQEILGHSSDEMTEWYNHPDLSDTMKTLLPFREQIDKILDDSKIST